MILAGNFPEFRALTLSCQQIRLARVAGNALSDPMNTRVSARKKVGLGDAPLGLSLSGLDKGGDRVYNESYFCLYSIVR